MVTITVTGPVVVTDDETEEPITDAGRLRTFDGLHSGKETCSKYHANALADLKLKGGVVKLAFDAAAKKLRVVSAFTSARKLTPAELRELIDDTEGQWSDGIGEGCFDSVMDKRNVFIDLSPLSGGKVTATQADDGKPAPKKAAPKKVVPKKATAGALTKAAAAGNLDEVKQLVAAKADLDARGQDGRTPLIAAIANDHLDVALYLIKHGASPTATDQEKGAPFRWAAVRSGAVKAHQNVKLAEALLVAGAPVDPRDADGLTPLMWAANSGAVKLLDLLLAHHADVNVAATGEGYAGRTALALAKGIAAVRAMLDAGADPKAVDADEMPAWQHHTGAARKLIKERAGVK